MQQCRMTVEPIDALAGVWRGAGLPEDALPQAALPGTGPVLPSSFAVATAAQASLAAAALAAAELWCRRTARARQRVTVDRRHAALETTGWHSVDGRVPDPWDRLSGLYRCADDPVGVDGEDGGPGWVRLHANFAHHRDGALRLLGLPPGPQTPREAVEHALRRWRALDFEQAAADAGLVVAAARGFAAWDAHPQSRAIAAQPLVAFERVGDAEPLPLPVLPAGAAPLAGLRVLDLTRILAGPVACRTLAAYGADVLRIGSPALPEIAAIADTGRGKRSALLDLRTDAGHAALDALVGDAHVFVQAYRPGGLDALGFGAQALARRRPGIVAVSLSAYGHSGPWATRRGFDSLVQTATGFNVDEARAAGTGTPKPMPVQILDYAAGFLMAFGAQAGLLRQAVEGGSWHVRVSLARTGLWLRGLGRVADGLAATRPPFDDLLETTDSGFGRLVALRHAAAFDASPVGWRRPSMPPGSHAPTWTDAA
jgi:hypothetical protein